MAITPEFDDALGASYRLRSRLGQGATGDVWLATDTRTDTMVAAKLLHANHAADPLLVERFVRERSLLVGLRHPNIVAVSDLVVEGDRIAIIMEYVDGGSLREALTANGPFPAAVAVDVAAAVLDGVTAAHEQGVLHRDIKPDNVLLVAQQWRTAAPGTIKVTDFGISRIVTDRARVTTGLLGTPEYMSPELIATGACDLPSDVYGVGIVLYELLAGRTPFAGPGTDYTIAHRHVTTEPPPLGVPSDLWTQLTALLAKDPAQRPSAATAAAALRALRTSLTGIPALPPAAAPTFTEQSRPRTVLRGMHPVPDIAPVVADAVVDEPAPDLGTPTQGTVVRAMPHVAPPIAPAAESKDPETPPERNLWRNPRVIALFLGALAILIGAGVIAIITARPESAAQDAGGTAKAQQLDHPTRTGLTVSRTAEYDPASHTIHLTITYAAQTAPLKGPFLEVLPGMTPSDACPAVTWTGAVGQPNLPTNTGITTRCGWSITTPQIPAQQTATVTATVSVALPDQDSAAELQTWLNAAAAATTSSVTDAQVTGTSYPVQRLQGVQVLVPPRTVSGTQIPVSLLPIWPSGPDAINPLYRSPSIGDPSTMLVAIAGGEDGIKFRDGCSGATAVSADGLTVTALALASSCTVNAQVGNFTNLVSNTVDIVVRGG